jgi:serine/threonine-protein kinase
MSVPVPTDTLIAGRYRVFGEIGRGAMGAVWLVEHVHTGDQLALKVMHHAFGGQPELVERFRREARAAAKIKSEHVVRVIDADISPELGGMPFMVMEMLNGEDTRRRLRTVGAFTREQTIHMLWQVARALDRAHAVGIVHRDIKPENIFLHRNDAGIEIIKLLDFGVAKMRDDLALDDGQATQAGTLLGTPYYMAPEQVRNGAITPQTDVWAVGMLATRFLTGASYWPSATTGELMAMILAEPMQTPSSKFARAALPPAFDAWFARSCDRDPARRWASVGEQVAALADAFALPVPASISMSGPYVPATGSHSGVQPAPGLLQPQVLQVMAPPSEASLSAALQATAPPAEKKQSPVIALVVFGLVVVLGVGGFIGFLHWQAKQAAASVAAATSPAVATPKPTATAVSPTATATVDPATTTATATATTDVPGIDPNTLPTATTAATVNAGAPPTATTTTTGKKKPTDKGADDPWAR